MYTLQDARSEVANVVVPGGTCATGGHIDRRINAAVRRLMTGHDAPEAQAILTIVTDKNYVTLPRGVKAARAVNICGVPTPQYHYSYSFAPAGPGDFSHSGCPVTTQAAPGSFPTAFDHHEGMVLIAFSTSNADVKKNVRVYGRRANGEDIVGGFDLPIRRWKNGVDGEIQSTREFSGPETSLPLLAEITDLTLPTGLVGYVSLLAVNPETWSVYFLSKYHPEEIKPGYQRIYLRNLGCCPCDSGQCREVTFLTKQDFIPLTREDELLPIQSLDAIKFMVMSIAEEDQRNPQMAKEYHLRAMSALNAATRDKIDGQQLTLNMRSDADMSQVGSLYGF